RLIPHDFLHVLDRLPVPLVVERREMVHRRLPLGRDVRVAAPVAAGLRFQEEVVRDQAVVDRGDRGREERALLAPPLLERGLRRGGRVHDGGGGRREQPEAPARCGRQRQGGEENHGDTTR